MTPSLLISQKVVTEFGTRLTDILQNAPRPLEILAFTPATKITPAQLDGIEATFYSRDIWEGTIKTALSPAAKAYWPIVDAAPNLKWLQVVSAGADQRPYQPSIQRGIRVTTSAGANAEPVGLTAMTGLMMLSRGFPTWMRAQQRREWAPQLGAQSPRDLRGQTAVIVGMGHIGTVIARSLHAMGVRTIGLRRRVAPAEYFDEVLALSALDSLLPKCDWLVLACPLTADTRGLMDARRFALLPRHAGFVNVSRGEVIDEAALADTLAGGHLMGAYLDVFTTEPLSPDSPLWAMPNVVISPHNSAASVGNYARGVEIFLRNLGAYLRGQPPLENEVTAGGALIGTASHLQAHVYQHPMAISDTPTVAVFTKNSTNPAYAAARLGADRAARRLSAHTLHYVPRTPDDVGEQIALIDEALALDPDAFVLVPVHPTAINPSIRKINAAGIPVVGYINHFTEGGCVTYVGSEDYPLAISIAGYLFERLQGRGKVVIVEGPADSVTSLARVRGFRDAAQNFPGIDIVASCCGDYQREPAKRVVAELLRAMPRIDGILAANDIMAMGIIEALTAAGRHSAIVGVNAIPEAIDAIRHGSMLATVNFDAMQMGYLATEAAVRHLRGEALPAEIILPVRIVDRTNCAEWNRPFEQRECVAWEDAVKYGTR